MKSIRGSGCYRQGRIPCAWRGHYSLWKCRRSHSVFWPKSVLFSLSIPIFVRKLPRLWYSSTKIRINLIQQQLGSNFLFVAVFIRTWVTTLRSGQRAIPNPSVVCLSSVTFVRPIHGVETFGNISSSFCTLAILSPPCKILRRLSNVRSKADKYSQLSLPHDTVN